MHVFFSVRPCVASCQVAAWQQLAALVQEALPQCLGTGVELAHEEQRVCLRESRVQPHDAGAVQRGLTLR